MKPILCKDMKINICAQAVNVKKRLKRAKSPMQWLSATYRFNGAKSQYKGKAAAGDELERLH